MNLFVIGVVAFLAVAVHCAPVNKNSNKHYENKNFTIDDGTTCTTYRYSKNTTTETNNGQTVTGPSNGIAVCSVEKCNEPSTVSPISCEEYQQIYDTRPTIKFPDFTFATFSPIKFPNFPNFPDFGKGVIRQ